MWPKKPVDKFVLNVYYVFRSNPRRFALVAEWYTQQVEGLCREAWWFESTRGHYHNNGHPVK
jgi:hypothetical protein